MIQVVMTPRGDHRWIEALQYRLRSAHARHYEGHMNHARDDAEVQTDCPICLETLQEGRLVAHVYSTGSHLFHAPCLWRYIQGIRLGSETPCPMCRQPMGYSCYEGAKFFGQ